MTFNEAQEKTKELLPALLKAPDEEEINRMVKIENQLRKKTSILASCVALILAVIVSSLLNEFKHDTASILFTVFSSCISFAIAYCIFNLSDYSWLARKSNKEYRCFIEKYSGEMKSKQDYAKEIRDLFINTDIFRFESEKKNYVDTTINIQSPEENNQKGYRVYAVIRYYTDIDVQTGEPSYKSKTINILSDFNVD